MKWIKPAAKIIAAPVVDALLAVLDPQQNHEFSDRYLGFPFDLSKVLFVCTVNDPSKFPPELLSRVEKIEFPAYLPDEKVEIAMRHLVQKQMAGYNIPHDKIKFDPPALMHLIQFYTHEGGVRQLETRIKTLIRIASSELDHSPNGFHVTPEYIDSKLTHKIWPNMINPHEAVIGEVNGLYYTPSGGGIIPVQAVSIRGGRKVSADGVIGEQHERIRPCGPDEYSEICDAAQNFIENPEIIALE